MNLVQLISLSGLAYLVRSMKEAKSIRICKMHTG
jgi:hypothetical protein